MEKPIKDKKLFPRSLGNHTFKNHKSVYLFSTGVRAKRLHVDDDEVPWFDHKIIQLYYKAGSHRIDRCTRRDEIWLGFTPNED
jgi:hypothetical protein